jgi:hypothetical protein
MGGRELTNFSQRGNRWEPISVTDESDFTDCKASCFQSICFFVWHQWQLFILLFSRLSPSQYFYYISPFPFDNLLLRAQIYSVPLNSFIFFYFFVSPLCSADMNFE